VVYTKRNSYFDSEIHSGTYSTHRIKRNPTICSLQNFIQSNGLENLEVKDKTKLNLILGLRV